MNMDFQLFLESTNDELFDNQLAVTKSQENIMKLREKTLKKIEKQLKKQDR